MVAFAAASVALGATPAVRAQSPPSPPPTSKGLLEQVLNQLLSPPTSAPVQPAAAPVPQPPSPTPGPAPAPSPGSAPAPPDDPDRVIPDEFRAIINSPRARTGPRTTTPLLDALRRLEDLGLSAEEVAVLGMGRFPVAGPADYTDDWLDPRFGPPFHLHQGCDIFADRGTPVIAPEEGVVRFEEGGLGGRAAYVTTADGTYYYMAHLNSYERSLYSGARVARGDVVAYVGNTGNASNGAPHLHFEVHPYGGGAVNPKPILDQWLAEAIEAAPALLAAYRIDVPRAIVAAGLLRRFDEGGLSGSGRPPETALLWASSVSAGGGTLGLAEAEAVRLAGGVDWDHRATTAQLQADVLREARTVASSVLAPLTPPLVVLLLGPAFSPGSS